MSIIYGSPILPILISRFVPDGNQHMTDKEVYLFGELTNYGMDDKAKMVFNPDKGVYETDLLLKNGYYNYDYVTIGKQGGPASFDYTEGNLWDTENSYTILVYYRGINGRADELVGITHINSLMGEADTNSIEGVHKMIVYKRTLNFEF